VNQITVCNFREGWTNLSASTRLILARICCFTDKDFYGDTIATIMPDNDFLTTKKRDRLHEMVNQKIYPVFTEEFAKAVIFAVSMGIPLTTLLNDPAFEHKTFSFSE